MILTRRGCLTGPRRPLFFFFNDTATTEIYTLSLHDALPISPPCRRSRVRGSMCWCLLWPRRRPPRRDRKSTRLNSSHSQISYAVFCLKKKKYTPHRTALPRIVQRHCSFVLHWVSRMRCV